MKRIAQCWFAALLAGALVACAGPRVATDYDSSVRFDALQAFAWLSPEYAEVDDPLLDSELLTRKMRRSVVAELTDRGYVAVPEAADADFIVTYHTASRERLRDRGGFSIGLGIGRMSRHSRQSLFLGDNYFPRIEGYQEGTLIIDVIDARSRELVWRGWTRDEVDTRRFSDEAIDATVREILGEFPPGHVQGASG